MYNVVFSNVARVNKNVITKLANLRKFYKSGFETLEENTSDEDKDDIDEDQKMYGIGIKCETKEDGRLFFSWDFENEEVGDGECTVRYSGWCRSVLLPVMK